MSHVLVTGAGGFVGSQIATDLAGQGRRITATWRRDHSRLDGLASDSVRAVRADLADPQSADKLFGSVPVEAVVHAAAFVSGANGPDALAAAARDNVQAQASLVRAALRAGCRRFLYCSTISVYGGKGAGPGGYLEADAQPSDIYGWSKLAGEQVLDLASEIDTSLIAVSLRLAGVHGRGRTSGALHTMAAAVRAGQPIVVKERDSRFRWLFIDDLVKAVRALLDAPLPVGHNVCNLASEDTFTLPELAERVRALCASSSPIETSGSAARNEVMNIDRARALWGYAPTGVDVFLRGYLGDAAAAK